MKKHSDSPIYLRELEKKDLAQLNNWRNDKKLLDLLGNNFLFISGAVDDNWFDNYLQNREKAVRLAIILKKGDLYIGNVNLTSIHAINRSAEFSLMIGEETHRGKGIGLLATNMMLQHAFKDRGLNRVHLDVLKENAAAIKLYEKAGFKREGVKRQDIFKNGTFHDVVMMSQLKEEFSYLL